MTRNCIRKHDISWGVPAERQGIRRSGPKRTGDGLAAGSRLDDSRRVTTRDKVKDHSMAQTPKHSVLDRALGVFTDVHTGEGLTAVLLSLNIFLILMASYVLKPVREALILGKDPRAQVVHVCRAGRAAGVRRACLRPSGLAIRPHSPHQCRDGLLCRLPVAFYVLARYHVPLAIVFFLWIGIFNLMVIAQFWSFANDIYTKDQGGCLFAIVGFGASLGAVAGSRVADRPIEPVGIYQMMLVGAGILVAQLLIANYLDRRGPGHATPTGSRRLPRRQRRPGRMRFRSSQDTVLMMMALMLMLANWVNTTGEYILGSIVKDTVSKTIAAGRPAASARNR